MIARMDFGRAAPKSIQDRCSGSGSLAMLAAIRRASSRVRSLPADYIRAAQHARGQLHRCRARLVLNAFDDAASSSAAG